MKKETKRSLESSDSRNKLDVDVKKSHSKSKDRSKDREHKSKEEKEQKAKEEGAKPKEKEPKVKDHKSKDVEHKPKDTGKSKEKASTSGKKTEEVKMKETEKAKETVTNGAVTDETVAAASEAKNSGRRSGRLASLVTTITKYAKNLHRYVKPPVVLVYADSVVAKENVKQALHDILNRERLVGCFLSVNFVC